MDHEMKCGHLTYFCTILCFHVSFNLSWSDIEDLEWYSTCRRMWSTQYWIFNIPNWTHLFLTLQLSNMFDIYGIKLSFMHWWINSIRFCTSRGKCATKWRTKTQDSCRRLKRVFLIKRTGYTMYKKLALSKVEKLKTTIFPSGH